VSRDSYNQLIVESADYRKSWVSAEQQITATYRARTCKRIWSPGIDSEESIPPGYEAWWAGTTNRVVDCRTGPLGRESIPVLLKRLKFGLCTSVSDA
jgi:hypothetical protein